MKRTTLVTALALYLGCATTTQVARAETTDDDRPSNNRPNNGHWQRDVQIGVGLGTLILGAFEEANRRPPPQQQHHHDEYYYPPQQQQQYYPPQPQYVPVPQYTPVPAQPVKPVAVKPLKNSVPKVVKPIALKANLQSLSRGVKVASMRYAKDTARALNLASQQSVDDLRTGLEDSKAILSEQDKKVMEAYLKMTGAPQDKIDKLMDALNANDPQAIQNAARDLNLDSLYMDNGMTSALMAGADLTNHLNDLQNAIGNGASPDQVGQLAGLVAGDIQQMGLPAVNTLGLNELLNQVVLSSQVTGGMGNGSGIGPAGMPTEFPNGDCLIVCDPNMASGQCCLLPGETLCVGTGGQGQLQVMEGTAADAMGLPSGTEPPVEDANGTAAIHGVNGVTIINPEATGAVVNYTLGTQSFTLEPGQAKQHGTTNQTIVFDKGENQGEVRYSLGQGTYRFSANQNGWELSRATFSVTIDNSDSPIDFSYAFNNEQVTVSAGSVKTHTSNSLPVVRFNKGDEGEDARKELDSGTYYVAINPETNLIDVFATKPEPSKIAVLKKKTGRQTVKKFGLQK